MPLSPNYLHRAPHIALFKTELLRKIGGYYGGFHIGYDTMIMNFLLMTGKVSYINQPLYSCVKRPKSLTNSKATAFGSARRRQVRQQQERIYSVAYEMYTRYRSGEVKLSAVFEVIGEMTNRHIAPIERDELIEQSKRLRLILSNLAKK